LLADGRRKLTGSPTCRCHWRAPAARRHQWLQLQGSDRRRNERPPTVRPTRDRTVPSVRRQRDDGAPFAGRAERSDRACAAACTQAIPVETQTAHRASAGMQRGAPPPWSMGQRRQRHRFPTEKKLDLPQLHRGRPQREARRRLRSVAVPLSDSTRPWGIGQQLAASRNTSSFF